MMINKSEALSTPDVSPYETVNETKKLGVLFYPSQKVWKFWTNVEFSKSKNVE